MRSSTCGIGKPAHRCVPLAVAGPQRVMFAVLLACWWLAGGAHGMEIRLPFGPPDPERFLGSTRPLLLVAPVAVMPTLNVPAAFLKDLEVPLETELVRRGLFTVPDSRDKTAQAPPTDYRLVCTLAEVSEKPLGSRTAKRAKATVNVRWVLVNVHTGLRVAAGSCTADGKGDRMMLLLRPGSLFDPAEQRRRTALFSALKRALAKVPDELGSRATLKLLARDWEELRTRRQEPGRAEERRVR